MKTRYLFPVILSLLWLPSAPPFAREPREPAMADFAEARIGDYESRIRRQISQKEEERHELRQKIKGAETRTPASNEVDGMKKKLQELDAEIAELKEALPKD